MSFADFALLGDGAAGAAGALRVSNRPEMPFSRRVPAVVLKLTVLGVRMMMIYSEEGELKE